MADLGTIGFGATLAADDTNYHALLVDTTYGPVFTQAMDNVPGDFGTMDTLAITIVARLDLANNDDVYRLSWRLATTGGLLLAAFNSGGNPEPTGNPATGTVINANSDQTISADAFAYVNTTADAAAWNDARLEVHQHHTQNMGPDGNRIMLDYAAVTGTYTIGATFLTVPATTHSHASDAPTLTQAHTLAVDDTAHAHAVDAPTISESFVGYTTGYTSGYGPSTTETLVVAASTHGHTSETPTLVEQSTLTVADSSHGHSSETPSLTQVHALAVDDSSHSHVSDSPTLTQALTLAVDDSTHAHTVDTVQAAGFQMGFTGGLGPEDVTNLAVDDTTHGHTADNVDLVLNTTLVVADTTHGHAAEAVALAQTHQLVVNDSAQGHVAETAVLTQVHTLAVGDTTHGHLADIATLTQAHTLVVGDTTHAHTSETPTLSEQASLVVADSTHGHTADNAILTQVHVLAVDDTTHGHAADNVVIVETVIDPTNLQVAQVGSDVEITWDSEVLAGVTNVDIFRRLGTDTSPFVPGADTRLVRIPAGVGSYTDTTVSDGDYVYQAFSVRVEP